MRAAGMEDVVARMRDLATNRGDASRRSKRERASLRSTFRGLCSAVEVRAGLPPALQASSWWRHPDIANLAVGCGDASAGASSACMGQLALLFSCGCAPQCRCGADCIVPYMVKHLCCATTMVGRASALLKRAGGPCAKQPTRARAVQRCGRLTCTTLLRRLKWCIGKCQQCPGCA